MADVSVRPASLEDAREVARLQLATWRTAYGSIVPAHALDELGEEQAVAQWRAAVESPPTPRHHVLVALEQQWLVGFAAFGPAPDDDLDAATTGGIAALLVEPRWGRRGHGSRLLAATVDHLRDDGFALATVWLLARDTASMTFYRSAGWERDGAVRVLDMAGTYVDEVRLHTAL
jgi:GNAT superfamily N-acetyltransferase